MVAGTRGSSGAGTGVRVGVALAATEMAFTAAGATRAGSPVRRLALDRMSGDNGAVWPALADAFREVARVHGPATVAVSLMGSLAEVRELQLPAMREADLQQLLTRSASRYFVHARSSQVIGALRDVGRGGDNGASPVVAAAAPQRVVSAIHAAARDAGLTVECVVTAPGAWAAAAAALWPATARGAAQLLVSHADHTDLLTLQDGRLAGIRRFRSGAADAAQIADALGGAGRSRAGAQVFALGRADENAALGRALAERRITVVAAAAEWRDRSGDPDALAATFAAPAAAPALDSDEVRASRADRRQQVLRWVVGGTVALLLVAAALEWWGAHREWRAVQAQRESLRTEVAATLVGRTTVETALRQLATLNAEQQASPRWGALLAAVSNALDDEAYLTAFRARGDSVVFDGLASRAARAFATLEKIPGLTAVRAAAPVRREAPSDGPALERFSIAARLAPRGRP